MEGDLVFANLDGTIRNPNTTTQEWLRFLAEFELLIAAGVDPVSISRRLGHASPTITLGIYGHLFENISDRAADVIEAALGNTLTE